MVIKTDFVVFFYICIVINEIIDNIKKLINIPKDLKFVK